MQLAALLNAHQFVGLAVWKTPTGYAASVEVRDREWGSDAVGSTAAEAVRAALGDPMPSAPTCLVSLPPDAPCSALPPPPPY